MTGYLVRLKNGAMFTLDDAGNILRDHERGMTFAPDGKWRIVGFCTRHNSRRIVSLSEAVSGESIGHGLVVDRDHGTLRQWSHPSNRRAANVTRIRETT